MDLQSRDFRDGILLNRGIFWGRDISSKQYSLEAKLEAICVGPVGLGKGGRSDGGADIRISLSIRLQY